MLWLIYSLAIWILCSNQVKHKFLFKGNQTATLATLENIYFVSKYSILVDMDGVVLIDVLQG